MTQILEPPQTRAPHRFTGEQYRQMYDLGIFGFERRSELIGGQVFFMAAMGRAHYQALRIFNRILSQTYSHIYDIVPQAPIRIFNDSEPEPDFVLIRRDAPTELPIAESVYLAIEISDSTLVFDRTTKLALYAQSQIPEYWILNLVEAQLEVYTQPSGNRYAHLQILKSGEVVTPLFAPDSSLVWWTAL